MGISATDGLAGAGIETEVSAWLTLIASAITVTSGEAVNCGMVSHSGTVYVDSPRGCIEFWVL